MVPNVLTMLRIGLIPLILYYSYQSAYSYALGIFVFAGMTDALDGIVAKRYGLVSEVGAVLDPIADKLLLVSTYVMLFIVALLPWWVAAVVVIRDVMVVAGFFALKEMHKDMVPKPTMLSKCNTFVQIVLIVMVLLDAAQWINPIALWLHAGYGLVVAFTAAAGFQSLFRLRVHHRRES